MQPDGIHHWEFRLFITCAQLNEQVKGFVENFFGASVCAVNLVDHHQHAQPQAQRLAQDEARLRHGSFNGINQE